jgi:hypothetical protein
VEHRGAYWPVWGARRVTYLNSTRKLGYTTKLSYLKGFWVLAQMFWLTLALWLGYRGMRDTYMSEYPEITAPEAWHRRLDFDPNASAPAQQAAE